MTAGQGPLDLGVGMKRTPLRAALLVLVAVLALGAALPALASEAPPDPVPIVRQWRPFPQGGGATGGESDSDVWPTVYWAIGGVAAGCFAFGTLYLLKRQLGGFPKNPSWVAPITVMPSRDFPDETTFGEGAPDPHGSHH